MQSIRLRSDRDAFAVAPGATPHQFIVTANAGVDTINLTCHFGMTAATDPVPHVRTLIGVCRLVASLLEEWWSD